MSSYDIAFHHATAHGVVAGVALPKDPAPVPDEVLARLHASERDLAVEMRGYRQVQFVGGRLALHAAGQQLGLPPVPVLPDERGTPVLPDGYTGSVSHKREIAVALVARARHGTVGVDIEEYDPPRLSIASRILVEEELAAIAALPDDRRWIAMLLRFSLKEAIYKALDPYVRRYVGFHEAIVTPDLRGGADVRLELANGEGPFDVEARYEWLHGRVLTSVRLRRPRRDEARPGSPVA